MKDFVRHRNDCDFKTQTCTDCQQVCKSSEYWDHKKNCSRRWTICNLCRDVKSLNTFSQLQNLHWQKVFFLISFLSLLNTECAFFDSTARKQWCVARIPNAISRPRAATWKLIFVSNAFIRLCGAFRLNAVELYYLARSVESA
jgi:hypothetical protein